MAAYETVGETDDWYTPAYIFEAMGVRFDLDVASPPSGPLHVPANKFIAPPRDGLNEPWTGFVWMNPPFGHQSTKRAWLARFFDHGSGVALLPDRTSAPWWQEAAPRASAVLFVSPKVKFIRPDGSRGEQPGTGTTLLSTGERGAEALMRARDLGALFRPFNTKEGS